MSSARADQFNLRLPHGMREVIRRVAERSKRSMNSEINYQLERAYGLQGEAAGDEGSIKAPAASEDTSGLKPVGNVNHG